MRFRRSLGPVAAFLVLAAQGLGAEPKAALSGPRTWFKDWPITLRLAGTVSDETPSVVLASGPEQSAQMTFVPYYDRDRRLVWVQTIPAAVGRYRFSLIARGKVEGVEAIQERVASIDVDVIEFGMVPAPGPMPIPTPTPVPTPAPDSPIAQKGTYRVLVLHQDLQMSRGQERVFNSPVLVDRLNGATMQDPDGRASWRKLDVDTPILGDEARLWAPLVEEAKQALGRSGAPKLPVIVFFQYRPDGSKHAHVYPIPEDDSGMNEILRRFGS